MRILCRWRVLPKHPAWVVDFAVVAIDPASRGRVTLVSADPMQPPRIDPGYLTAPADVDVLRRGMELARAIAATASCRAAGIGAEVLPGAGSHARAYPQAGGHLVSSRRYLPPRRGRRCRRRSVVARGRRFRPAGRRCVGHADDCGRQCAGRGPRHRRTGRRLHSRRPLTNARAPANPVSVPARR